MRLESENEKNCGKGHLISTKFSLGDCVVMLVTVLVVLVIVVVVLAIAWRNGVGFSRRSHRGGFRFKLETDTFLHAVDNWPILGS